MIDYAPCIIVMSARASARKRSIKPLREKINVPTSLSLPTLRFRPCDRWRVSTKSNRDISRAFDQPITISCLPMIGDIFMGSPAVINSSNEQRLIQIFPTTLISIFTLTSLLLFLISVYERKGTRIQLHLSLWVIGGSYIIPLPSIYHKYNAPY